MTLTATTVVSMLNHLIGLDGASCSTSVHLSATVEHLLASLSVERLSVTDHAPSARERGKFTISTHQLRLATKHVSGVAVLGEFEL